MSSAPGFTSQRGTLTGSSIPAGSFAERVYSEIVAIARQLRVRATLETDVGAEAEEDRDAVISLEPSIPTAAPCSVYVDGERMVVISIGRGLRWEIEGSPEQMLDNIRDVVVAVLSGRVRERSRLDRDGSPASTKGTLDIGSRILRMSGRDMTRNQFFGRRVDTDYEPYAPGDLDCL